MGWYLTFVGAGSEELALALDHFRRAGDLHGQGWAHQITALAYAMMGDTAQAQAMKLDLNQHYPLDTQVQSLWLPAINAQMALNQIPS